MRVYLWWVQLMLKRLVISLLLILSTSLYANGKRYQLELLVFSHITPKTLQSEQWPIIPAYDNPISDEDNTPAFSTVPTDDFILTDEARRLSKQPNYQILYHGAWIVFADTLDNAQTLYIKNNVSDLGGSELNGSLKISLNRYFNIHLQLYLNENTDSLRNIADNPAFEHAPNTFHFILNQSRRMRSRELNYIAQPVFGALIKIIPLKNKRTSTNDKATTNGSGT